MTSSDSANATALPPRKSRRSKLQAERAATINNADEDHATVPRFCVIGGGIAGVCCAQELSRLNPTEQIVLVSATDCLREATAVMKLTSNLEELSVFERRADQFSMDNKNIMVVTASLSSLDYSTKTLHLSSGKKIAFSQVCFCTGSQPKTLLSQSCTHPKILTIRDIQSVHDMTKCLLTARRVAVVGNGGISMELVTALTFCEVSWVIKDSYVGSAFFDATASAFVVPDLLQRSAEAGGVNSSSSRDSGEDEDGLKGGMKRTIDAVLLADYSNTNDSSSSKAEAPRVQGSALGPEWIHKSALMSHLPKHVQSREGSLSIEYEDEVASVEDCSADRVACSSANANANGGYTLKVTTKRGKVIECDFLVSAIGVRPNNDFTELSSNSNSPEGVAAGSVSGMSAAMLQLERDPEGALFVDNRQKTSLPDVFAAGDCCTIRTAHKYKDDAEAGLDCHWFQMRLWTQARAMGYYAAQCMHEVHHQSDSILGDIGVGDVANDIVFEIFAHVTRFFGHKVVLLGRYNAQGLGANYESRVKEMVVTDKGLVESGPGALSAKKVSQGVSHGQEQYAGQALSPPPSTSAGRCTEPLKDVEIWVRVTPGESYVKVVVFRGKVVGALLLGDTDLEECMENLILNRIDVSSVGCEMLNPELDLEDYFD